MEKMDPEMACGEANEWGNLSKEIDEMETELNEKMNAR